MWPFRKARLTPPQDTFRLIAFNMAIIYHVLKQNYAYLFSKEADLILCACAIDLLKLLEADVLTLDRLQLYIRRSDQGFCSLSECEVFHEKSSNPVRASMFGTDEPLLNATMQVECLLFAWGSDSSHRAIIDTVILKKPTIRRTLDRTLYHLRDAPLPREVTQLVESFMTEDRYSQYRQFLLKSEGEAGSKREVLIERHAENIGNPRPTGHISSRTPSSKNAAYEIIVRETAVLILYHYRNGRHDLKQIAKTLYLESSDYCTWEQYQHIFLRSLAAFGKQGYR